MAARSARALGVALVEDEVLIVVEAIEWFDATTRWWCLFGTARNCACDSAQRTPSPPAISPPRVAGWLFVFTASSSLPDSSPALHCASLCASSLCLAGVILTATQDRGDRRVVASTFGPLPLDKFSAGCCFSNSRNARSCSAYIKLN